ncbi:triose-phosphate isomerase [Candidatus Woesearchaeota archaeon]|nr:triose-phosphate isomerase [Candidatus Woesearchaeota archaeon]
MPLFVVNFKTYENGTGKKALRLAKIIDKAAQNFRDTDIDIIVALQPADIRMIAGKVSIPVFGQHADPISFGPHTGGILLESLKEAGARGVIINHSEKGLKLKQIEKIIKKAKKMDFPVLVCAPDLKTGEKIKKLQPDFIAIEPPELIGGKKSVSTTKPGLIKKSVSKLGKDLIVGAGISKFDDVKKAIDFGANGVLISNAVVNAKNPNNVLKDMLSAF